MKTNIFDMLHSLSSKIDNSEQLIIHSLVKKADNYLKDNAHDKTVGIMNVTLNKMIDNNKAFISRADFKNLYNKSYNYGTKALSLFSEELNIKEAEYVEKKPSIAKKDIDISGGDKVLNKALAGLFGGEVKEYNENIANKAIKTVSSTLGIWGLAPKNLQISSGNDKVLLIQASYETPKGITNILIPVETKDNLIIESGMFLGNDAPQELNYNNLKNYIKANSGIKLTVNASVLLETLTNKLGSNDTAISQTEMALIRLRSKKASATEFSQNYILGQKLDEVTVKDIQQERFAETDLFEKKLANSYGEAVFKFGSDIVTSGREVIFRKLASFGYKNPQVKLTGFKDNLLQYAVALESVAFNTSVKIKDSLVNEPTYIISNGSVSAFTPENINELITKSFDSKAAAIASPMFDLNDGELVSIVESAVLDKNYTKAEDALNILNQNNSISYHKALDIYLNSLKGNVVATKSECSKMIKHAASNCMICSHTGLPINKVTQDKYGNCIPLYRKKMNDTFDGVISMTSKVFL